MEHFLNMGGYARYVWPSYALALLAVVLNIYWARRSLRDAQSQARRRIERAGQSDAIKKGAP
ncbi:MAG TPA: heme exporter protein CcmD [Steroidobacteraceae bacterium]|nr:heme exporter protein CcmD [Steroidobacteraceae bacterium]